jgi:hypothetical protein
MDNELLLKDGKVDQRPHAFLATHDSAFANCFPDASDETTNFDNRELHAALARNMGVGKRKKERKKEGRNRLRREIYTCMYRRKKEV